ncbi:MAG: M13 family metallopeptidase [Acidobacteriota bacterium]|nr:M13 family metallopeptidase [Acidobacteriota bacterium]
MRKHFPKVVLGAALLLATRTDRLAGAGAAVATRGLDVAGMDRTVNPGDDFYAYANGGWMKATPIPADRSTWGLFGILAEEVNARTAGLIRQAGESKPPPGSDAAKVGAYYDAYMDEKAIEAKGLGPIQPELEEIAAIADGKALARVVGRQLRADVDALNNTRFHTDRVFGVWVSPDFSAPDRNVAYLMQGGLGMPDRDNYRNTGAKDVELQAQYKTHVAAVLKLARIPDAETRGGRVYELERKIADAHVSRTESEDVLKANNPWRLQDFPARAPGLEWGSFFDAAGLSGQPMVMVWQPAGVSGIASLAGSQPLEAWKDYLTFHAIDRASGLLPKAFADERFHFYGTVLTGAPSQRPRWKRAVDATGSALGEAVGRLYVERYFPPAAKAQAQKMVANIIAAFGRRIDNLEWMTPATREKAKAKLATLYVGIGYPDRWKDYSGLAVARGDALGNFQRAELFDYRRSLAKLGKPVDKTEWWMTPQTVNAVNLPLQNALNFPAAILNPPFFDVGADPAQNYGAIGTVIGHEISHSFDDQGSQFDAQGRLLNWWTPEDFAHFGSAAARLAAEFDTYEPLPGMHVNGKLTLSENIADVAGIAAAFDGYRVAREAGGEQHASGFTGDQRFFLAFAQAWRGKQRPEALRGLLITDGHAPGEFRADTVRNIDAWYRAFDVQPGRKLYLSPESRVRIW